MFGQCKWLSRPLTVILFPFCAFAKPISSFNKPRIIIWSFRSMAFIIHHLFPHSFTYRENYCCSPSETSIFIRRSLRWKTHWGNVSSVQVFSSLPYLESLLCLSECPNSSSLHHLISSNKNFPYFCFPYGITVLFLTTIRSRRWGHSHCWHFAKECYTEPFPATFG